MHPKKAAEVVDSFRKQADLGTGVVDRAQKVRALLTVGGPDAAAAAAPLADDARGEDIVVDTCRRYNIVEARPDVLMRLPPHPTFHTLDAIGDGVTQYAIQLVAEGVRDGERFVDPMGTAAIVGPHLGLTARHVVDDWFRQFGTNSEAKAINFNIFAFMVYEGNVPVLLRVRAMSVSPAGDLALLALEVMAEEAPFEAWPVPYLDFAIPRVGSRVFGIGFHSATHLGQEGLATKIQREVAVSSGVVLEVFDDDGGRDRGHLNFPCFDTDARFDAGMSGGPVFNERGCLCGVISSNLPPMELGERHASYVALLWPVLGNVIDFGRVGSDAPESFYDLVRSGLLKADGLADFSVETIDAVGRTTRLHRTRLPPAQWRTVPTMFLKS